MSDVFEERETSDDLVREVGERGGHDLPVVDGQGNGGSSRFDVRNLLSDGVKVHHLQDLQAAARLLDELRQQGDDAVEHELDLAELKLELSASKTLQEMVHKLGANEEALKLMASVIEDRALEELLTIRSGEEKIPLSDWPNSLHENFFAEVVKLAARKSPVTLSFLLRLVIKDKAANVEPKHVISVATVFSTLAQLVDSSNNVLAKIIALDLKMENTTDEGVDAMAKLGLSVQARNLRVLRDDLAQISSTLHLEDTRAMPEQSCIDNCDVKANHTTVEYRETEKVDTSHLCQEPMGREEVLALFTTAMVRMNDENHKEELDHLTKVILNTTGRVLAEALESRIGHWQNVLPPHHHHPLSHVKIEEAAIRLMAPHYRQVGFSPHFA